MIHPGFDDESNYVPGCDSGDCSRVLYLCTYNTAIWNRKYMLSCFISGNNFENNRWRKKELLERITGNFKNIMCSSLYKCFSYSCAVAHQNNDHECLKETLAV